MKDAIPAYIFPPRDSLEPSHPVGQSDKSRKRGSFCDIDCAGVALPQDELLAKVRDGMTAIIEGVQRARARKVSLARQASPLSIVATRAERRAKQKQASVPRRPTPLLTPLALRVEKAVSRKLRPTELDEMLTDDQTAALELWAACEQLLGGRAQAVGWNSNGRQPANYGPIPDAWMKRVNRHVALKRKIATTRPMNLTALSAFAAIQNADEGALSAAQYGQRIDPRAKNKRHAFLHALVSAASDLAN